MNHSANKTRPQAYLYNKGSKRIGRKEGVDPSVFPDIYIQRRGVAEAAKDIGITVLAATTLLVAGSTLLGRAIDRSPTMRHIETIEQEQAGKDLPGSVPYTPDQPTQNVSE